MTVSHWDSTALSPADAKFALAVAVVRRPAAGSHGTGWLVSPRHVVTNDHVVAGAAPHEIFIEFPDGAQHIGLRIDSDPDTDLAVVHVTDCNNRSPLKIDASDISIGTQVCTWGHPAPYEGPAPLMVGGHIAGFSLRDTVKTQGPQRRMVVNAAFNPGNSGGPLATRGETTVRGVVVSKTITVPPHLSAAITAMANQKGITISYPVHLPDGTIRRMVEAEIVADTLRHFFRMTQLVLGEAIMARDLVSFLDGHRIPWVPA